MHTDEISHLEKSCGKIISVNSFFSTSCDPTIAKGFIPKRPVENTEKVLFIITGKIGIGKTKPYADISQGSKYDYEREVLFVPGSVFRVKSTEINADVHEITMELCSENDNPVQSVYQKMRKDLGTDMKDVDLLLFGDLLYQISKYKLAEDVFFRLSKELSPSDRRMIRVNYFLGMLAYHEEDYKKSLAYYHKALAIIESTQSSNILNIVQLYNCIGEVHRVLEDYDGALKWQQKLLDICERSPQQHQTVLAHAYNNIGLVYEKKKEYGEAIRYHYKSLEINKQILHENHPDRARNHHNIGIVLEAMGQSQEAMKHYEKSLQIRISTLPTTHVSIGESHQVMGCLHYHQKRWDKALQSFSKADDIYKRTYGPKHNRTIRVEEYITRCNERLK